MGWLKIQKLEHERNVIFLRNKKILNPCFRWQILRSYRFGAEVTFNIALERFCKTLNSSIASD